VFDVGKSGFGKRSFHLKRILNLYEILIRGGEPKKTLFLPRKGPEPNHFRATGRNRQQTSENFIVSPGPRRDHCETYKCQNSNLPKFFSLLPQANRNCQDPKSKIEH